MSSEKNPEVVGCDASIMKNVWEIRVREYGQKSQLELLRVKRSALPRINQDWANRMNTGQGRYKRVERKTKPVETQTDDNAWKRKQPQIPCTLPRGEGLDPQSRPESQSKGFSTPVNKYKDKKGQDKTFNRLQLLMMITKTQPSAMVWGKSWKYHKSLPSPAEGSTDWGQCWMFASQQPCSEAGNPNGPNLTNPHSLHLWRKNYFRRVESHELDLHLPTEEWQLSWKKSDQHNKMDTPSGKGENIPKYGFSTLHPNEALCSSEWGQSWRSIKSTNQLTNINGPNDQFMNESNADTQSKDRELNSKWEDCWRIINHNGGNKSKLSLLHISVNTEWASSWKAAMVVSNNHKNSDPSPSQDHNSTNNKILPVFCEHKYIDQYLHLCNEFNALPEWSKSWQMTKNNSKPCEEIEKVLKALPPKEVTVLETQWLEKNPKLHRSEKADACYEQLKHDVIYQQKSEFNLSKLLLPKQLEIKFPSLEWLDSWKIIKHRMRLERRRMKLNPLQPFRESEKGGDMKPTASEWRDSWKFTCKPLHQDPNLWQQNLLSTAQISVNQLRAQSLSAPVELPKNGPTREQSWGESWMFSRQQHHSEPEQGTAQMSQGTSSCENSLAQVRQARLTMDWQASWMVSETEFHHDKPSLTQWREAWKWSINHTQHWTGQVCRENWVNDLMEIYPLKEKCSLQRIKVRMNWSFDKEMFRERYPENEWSSSWSTGSVLNYQLSHYGFPGISGQSICNITQQKHTNVNEHGSKWGSSFRLANPMPPMEHLWVESLPNPCHYSAMWSREKKIQNEIRTILRNTPKLWENSHKFLQCASAQKNPSDPRVIMSRKTKTKRHLFSNTDKEKQSVRKWAGSHLLGKTQPRPKKGLGSVKKANLEDKTETKFFEEWIESWRYLVSPDRLKNQMPFKPLSGWTESWKFLIPVY